MTHTPKFQGLSGGELLPVFRKAWVFLKTSHLQVPPDEFCANASRICLVWLAVHSEKKKETTSCLSAHTQRDSKVPMLCAISPGLLGLLCGIPVAWIFSFYSCPEAVNSLLPRGIQFIFGFDFRVLFLTLSWNLCPRNFYLMVSVLGVLAP